MNIHNVNHLIVIDKWWKSGHGINSSEYYCMYVCMYVYMYVCMYICIYVCMYVYTCT